MSNPFAMDRSTFRVLAQTRLPLVTGVTVDALVFGADPANPDVIALIHKNPAVQAERALVRLHSACITSEALGSAKCDCATQLDIALSMISQTDWGVLVYLLRHEGRGIGLVNKMRAYALQDKGLDTVDANLALGFGADDRDFGSAVRSLELLGIRRLALLTNNPEKEAVLRNAGFEVVERIPMDVPTTEHNRDYLVTKRRYFGHTPLRDPSTEFLTQEVASGMFAAELVEAHRDGAAVAAFAVHIDDFENWRDLHGPAIAEKRAAAIAQVVKRCEGLQGRTVARVRPDRFLILLRHADLGIARMLATRIEQAASCLRLSPGEAEFAVRLAFGLASREAGDSTTELIAEAMQAADLDMRARGARVVASLDDLGCSG